MSMLNTIETEIQESRLQRQAFTHRVAKFLDEPAQMAAASPRTKQRATGASLRRRGQIVTPRRTKATDIKFTINNQEAYFDITSALETDAIQKEASDLRSVFDFLDKSLSGYIDASDLRQVLGWLKHDCSEAQARDMIWDFDDEGSGRLSWKLFQAMYYRLQAKDAAAYEPRRLYNIADFLMFDADKSGTIDKEEAVRIFRRRFGTQGAEQARAAMWKANNKKKAPGDFGTDEDTSLTFTDFLKWDRKIFRDQAAAASKGGRGGMRLPPIGGSPR